MLFLFFYYKRFFFYFSREKKMIEIYLRGDRDENRFYSVFTVCV